MQIITIVSGEWAGQIYGADRPSDDIYNVEMRT